MATNNNHGSSLNEQSSEALAKASIQYETKNGGSHLIVEGNECFIDFWPGTGKWISRNGARGFGVRNLIKYAVAGDQYCDACFLYGKALELIQCAKSWEPDARILGNVKASEIGAILKDYTRLRLQEGIQ